MDTQKRKPPGREKKFKDNVAYLGDVLNDNMFNTPRSLLETILDNYRAKRCRDKKIIIITLGKDNELTFNQYGLKDSDFIYIGARVTQLGLDGYKDDE